MRVRVRNVAQAEDHFPVEILAADVQNPNQTVILRLVDPPVEIARVGAQFEVTWQVPAEAAAD